MSMVCLSDTIYLMDVTSSIAFFISIFSVTAVLLYFTQKLKSKPLRIILTVLTLAIPVIISGIRYNVGIDFPEYEKIFNNIIAGRPAWDHILEPTFYLFSWVSDFLTGNSAVLYTIYAGIFVGFSYLFIKKVLPQNHVPLATFVMLMTTFPMSMNIIRQSAAIAVCVFATWFIINKKPAWYAVSIILASTLHFSAIVLLPLYFIRYLFKNSKNQLRNIYITLGIAVVLCITAPFILQLLTSIPVFNHYSYLADFEQSFYISARLLANLFIIILVWLFAKKHIVKNQTKLIITTLFSLGICLQTISFFMRGTGRISLYLTSLLPIVLIYMLDAKNNKFPDMFKKIFRYKYFWHTIIVIISLAYFIGICLFDNSGYNILPYETIF